MPALPLKADMCGALANVRFGSRVDGALVLVENNTCPTEQILEVTGSCLKTTPEFDVARALRGTQYNCVKRGSGSNPHVIR